MDPSAVTAQLTACHTAAVVSTCGNNPGTCVGLTSPALMGFQMFDEPSAANFSVLAMVRVCCDRKPWGTPVYQLATELRNPVPARRSELPVVR